MSAEPTPVQWRCVRCSWTYTQHAATCVDMDAPGASRGVACGGAVTPCVWTHEVRSPRWVGGPMGGGSMSIRIESAIVRDR